MTKQEAISFSPNLQKFLKKKPHANRVFFDPKEKVWYLGYKDGIFFAGARFLAVLCNGKETQTYSFPPKMTERFVDRTEQFFKCTEYFGRRMFPRWY